MTTTVKCCIALAILLSAPTPSHAGSCASSIVRIQATVDAAIEKRAGSDGWKPESLSATRSYQPTPYSLATTEGVRGQDLEMALESLNRARAADSAGNLPACRRELAVARAIVRPGSH